jgi:hypothetical protein
MAFRLGPFNLIAGTAQDITLGVNPDVVQAVKLLNESSYALGVDGMPDDQDWLPAWHQRVYACKGIGKFSVEPTSIVSTAQVAQSSVLLVTMYLAGEKVPTNQEVALSRQVSNTAQALQYSSAVGAAGVSIFAKVASSPQQFSYLVGLLVTSAASGATANSLLDFGNVGSVPSQHYVESVSAGGYLRIDFTKPVRGVGLNTPITVTLAAGAADRSLLLWGFQQ